MEEIKFLDYGIVTIGNGEELLGIHLWELTILSADSIYNFTKKSKSTSAFVFFNLLEKIDQKNNKEVIIQVYKNEKEIHKQKKNLNSFLKVYFNYLKQK